MDDHDVPAVQRTEPEDAADEGYPIADDGGHARHVAKLAQEAIAAGTGLDDAEVYALAERFLTERPDGSVEIFLDWLRATRAKA